MSDKDVKAYFTNTISQDLLSLFAKKYIADGSTRTVYKINTEQVAKFETDAGRFQNILEWETWEIVKHTHYKKWFAPCIEISDNGAILVQAFCRDLEPAEVPAELPVFFADIKKENFGIYNGQVVSRDYGNSFLIDRGFNTNRMKKAEW